MVIPSDYLCGYLCLCLCVCVCSCEWVGGCVCVRACAQAGVRVPVCTKPRNIKNSPRIACLALKLSKFSTLGSKGRLVIDSRSPKYPQTVALSRVSRRRKLSSVLKHTSARKEYVQLFIKVYINI